MRRGNGEWAIGNGGEEHGIESGTEVRRGQDDVAFGDSKAFQGSRGAAGFTRGCRSSLRDFAPRPGYWRAALRAAERGKAGRREVTKSWSHEGMESRSHEVTKSRSHEDAKGQRGRGTKGRKHWFRLGMLRMLAGNQWHPERARQWTAAREGVLGVRAAGWEGVSVGGGRSV